MSEDSVYHCDGCGALTKNLSDTWLRSQHYIDVLEFSRTGGGGRRKYHLCHHVNEGDGDSCVGSDFQENPDGHDVSIYWAYDRDEGRISGAHWTEHWPYGGGWEDHEAHRAAFPAWLEERATQLENLLYDE